MRTCSNANDWNAQFALNALCKFFWNLFENDCETTCFLEKFRIFNQLLCLFVFFSANCVGSKLVDALRRKPKMSHDRNTCRQNSFNRFNNLGPTLKFDSMAFCFLHNSDGTFEGLSRISLVGSKRHVDDNECSINSTLNTLSVVDHVVERHWDGCHLTCHDVRSRIADKDHVNTCCIHEASKRVVVRRQHGDGFVGTLHFLKRMRRNFRCFAVNRHRSASCFRLNSTFQRLAIILGRV